MEGEFEDKQADAAKSGVDSGQRRTTLAGPLAGPLVGERVDDRTISLPRPERVGAPGHFTDLDGTTDRRGLPQVGL